jgi:CRP-like cAMP-binding protein
VEILLEDVAPGHGAPGEGIRSLRLEAKPDALPGRTAVAMPKEPDPGAAAAAARLLPRVPLFSELSPSAFQRLVRVVRLVRLREDGVLFREGDQGDALYIVVEGAVVPCAERPTRRRLAVLQEGEFFGEVALVTDQPRIATVRALVETTLLVLDADSVRELIQAEPGVMLVFLRFLRERLIHRLGQTSPLFRGFDAEGLRRFAARFEFLEVDDGAELVAQGEHSPRLFVALCGRYEVSVYDGNRVRTLAWLEPGDIFGEMSALAGEPAMATVTSRARGFVLALDADRFDALSSAHPPLVAGLRALAADRDRRNEEALRDPADAIRRHVDLV